MNPLDALANKLFGAAAANLLAGGEAIWNAVVAAEIEAAGQDGSAKKALAISKLDGLLVAAKLPPIAVTLINVIAGTLIDYAAKFAHDNGFFVHSTSGSAPA